MTKTKPKLTTKTGRPLIRSALSVTRALFKLYPTTMGCAVLLILFAGMLEGIGLMALLPLLDLLDNKGEEASQITQYFADFMNAIGLDLSIFSLVGLLIGAVMLKAVLQLTSQNFVGYTLARMTSDFRLRLLRALALVRWPFFTAEPMGRLSNSITVETQESAKAARGIIDLISVTIETLIYLGLALILSWKLTVAGLVAGAVMSAILAYFVMVSRREGARQQALMRSYTSRIIDWLNGVKAVKAMGLEGRIGPFLERETLDILDVQRRLTLANNALTTMQEPIAAIFAGIGLLVAILYFGIETNALLVMVAVFMRAVGRVGAIQKAIRKFATTEAFYYAYHQGTAHIENQSEPIDRPLAGGEAAPARFEERIELKAIAFAHDKTPVLQDLDLTIEAGSLISVVGPSGTGKSTLLDLLAGLLQPAQGQVLVDGVDLRRFKLQDWRRLIGYVPQETVLLQGSVRENLTFGEEIPEEDVIWALKAAGAWDFIQALPEGVETSVGERGMRFSGGQRQRLAIARALVRRPKLLLLDEATSALDADSEEAFCRQLAELAPPLTIVAISHRPAIEAVAHKTYRLFEGRIALAESAAGTAQEEAKDKALRA